MTPPDNFIFWGSAGHAMVLADVVRTAGGRILALFDNNNEAKPAIDGVPLFAGEAGFQEWLRDHDSDMPAGAVAIGGHRGADRVAILRMLESHGIPTPALLHPQAGVSPQARVGPGCQVLAMAVVAAGARLGRGVIVNHGALVDHESVLGEGCHIAPGAVLCGCVELGDHVFIGAGATVLPRLRIGANTIVGAGSVVTRDLPANSLAFGTPAKIQHHRS